MNFLFFIFKYNNNRIIKIDTTYNLKYVAKYIIYVSVPIKAVESKATFFEVIFFAIKYDKIMLPKPKMAKGNRYINSNEKLLGNIENI